MKTLLPLLVFGSFLLLNACDLSEDPPMQNDPPLLDTLSCTAAPGIQPVIFKALAVGQKSRFVFFTGENYFDTTGQDYQYHPDTLVMEIIDKEGIRFLVRECITPGSLPHNGVPDQDSVLYYYLSVENNFLRPRRSPDNTGAIVYSRLFFTREIPLPLSEITSQEMQLQGWKTAPANSGLYQEGFCENCELNGTAYPYLNFVVDNSDMAVDGPGFTWVYATNAGLVRCFTVNPWTGQGSGWDLLPD